MFRCFAIAWNGLMDLGIHLCEKGVAYCDRKIAEAAKEV
jgi:hypothetical protein